MILTVNGGSSSIKFAIYKFATVPKKLYAGELKRIGLPGMVFTLIGSKENIPCKGTDYISAISSLISWLKETNAIQITTIGHRIVHGMQHMQPCLITHSFLTELKQIIPYDPDHLPGEIKLIEAFLENYPNIEQIACFDTAFHQTMPPVAKLLPVPQRFAEKGIHRYGFHGLSYQYLMSQLKKQAGKKEARGRVVLAHLGSGASLAAVYKGKSMDTSMGFTPAGGIPMSSRSGDIDPGVAWIMMKTENLTPKQFNHLINHESGLLGISGTSGDMGDLLKQEANDERAARAVDLFCYQVKKWIGAYAAALGGIDTLVFAGGIGENSPVVRKRICERLNFLGIELNEKRNKHNAPTISKNNSRVSVRVIPTDEEFMIAATVAGMIQKNDK
jgi:acetate kinase